MALFQMGENCTHFKEEGSIKMGLTFYLHFILYENEKFLSEALTANLDHT